MNWLALLAYIPTIMQGLSMVKPILDEAQTNEDIVTKITNLAGPVGSLVSSVGAELFPHSSAALQMVGGAIAAFDPNTTKWIQKSCNSMLALSPPLTVDGHYGPLTKAAVEQLQTKLGLKVDGIAGMITQAAIQAATTVNTVKA